MAQFVALFRHEHQKTAAARSDEFPADRPVFHSQFIPLVNFWIAHAARAALLVLPMLVHQFAEEARIAFLERLLAAVAQLLNIVEIIQHIAFVAPRASILIFEDAAGAARDASEEQKQVVLEIEHGVHADCKRGSGHGVVPVEGEACHPANRRDILVLLAYRLAKALNLNMASKFGQLELS